MAQHAGCHPLLTRPALDSDRPVPTCARRRALPKRMLPSHLRTHYPQLQFSSKLLQDRATTLLQPLQSVLDRYLSMDFVTQCSTLDGCIDLIEIIFQSRWDDMDHDLRRGFRWIV